MSLGTKSKDPIDNRIYTFDWTLELDSDTIATSQFTVTPSGLSTVNSGIVPGGKKTSIQLSGGTAGKTYTVRNTITRTTSGETLSRSGTIYVRAL